jgi:hypothetical protein
VRSKSKLGASRRAAEHHPCHARHQYERALGSVRQLQLPAALIASADRRARWLVQCHAGHRNNTRSPPGSVRSRLVVSAGGCADVDAAPAAAYEARPRRHRRTDTARSASDHAGLIMACRCSSSSQRSRSSTQKSRSHEKGTKVGAQDQGSRSPIAITAVRRVDRARPRASSTRSHRLLRSDHRRAYCSRPSGRATPP